MNVKEMSTIYYIPRAPKNYSHFEEFNNKKLDHPTFYMQDNTKYPPITFLIIAL